MLLLFEVTQRVEHVAIVLSDVTKFNTIVKVD